MKVTRILAALALVVGFAGSAHAAGCARLSWGTCDPDVPNANYVVGTNTYQLVYSIFGSGDPNVGTDSQLRIRHYRPGSTSSTVPDSWRFDDSGCQTGSQLVLSNNALSKACPAYKGTNPLVITQYATDVDSSAFLRLAITYDNFSPSAAVRYTAWLITFDHSFSNIGPSPADLSSCGGVEQCENIYFDFANVLALTGFQLPLAPCDPAPIADPAHGPVIATWNGGCEAPVATQNTTWGKLKGIDRKSVV